MNTRPALGDMAEKAMVARNVRASLNSLALAVVLADTARLVLGASDEPFWFGSMALVAGLPFALALYQPKSRVGALLLVVAMAVNAVDAALFALLGAAARLNFAGTAPLVPLLALGTGLCVWNASALAWLSASSARSAGD